MRFTHFTVFYNIDMREIKISHLSVKQGLFIVRWFSPNFGSAITYNLNIFLANLYGRTRRISVQGLDSMEWKDWAQRGPCMQKRPRVDILLVRWSWKHECQNHGLKKARNSDWEPTRRIRTSVVKQPSRKRGLGEKDKKSFMLKARCFRRRHQEWTCGIFRDSVPGPILWKYWIVNRAIQEGIKLSNLIISCRNVIGWF